ncbi:MAG: 1,6-anhydro-N-acetylmuramyl-L-alanine amidase AmpD [Thiotrichales bacterium]|jgi:AmpD protein|nr:1,6-anhydro-N-acetylmuramyl-L-alanine amidase AmpD [Thiotrichales bacterium]MBT3613327.1 1,6-anhydro-N-acetylmuramyl-L-alanine amidase AmpD [Thiotrichales bacterium]MBT3752442.1 1,6-anhydro-N-acetylmuramyl-L-alanine amidase AmpD [Thiotrichales bacterium]MBT4152727.1 1,6-anhydro-N-acetylmuramyl-L-alanine amidase AmpD [Thiotrichales bacterium]MBT4261867.1 1,6-anhydro-N-acetylmuramyl-L-alanine amidase AmpD [Thiotrichales bacterium]
MVVSRAIERIDDRGWIQAVERLPSPNFDQRPVGTDIELVVIHGISLPQGEFGTKYIDKLFTNQLSAEDAATLDIPPELKVSTHLLIRRTGKITQFVPLSARAWHAGVSQFRGRDRCNDFSIGIELEGADDIPYSPVQYEALLLLLKKLMKTYPKIDAESIVGHSDIAPERKTDPGPAFEWSKIREEL